MPKTYTMNDLKNTVKTTWVQGKKAWKIDDNGRWSQDIDHFDYFMNVVFKLQAKVIQKGENGQALTEAKSNWMDYKELLKTVMTSEEANAICASDETVLAKMEYRTPKSTEKIDKLLKTIRVTLDTPTLTLTNEQNISKGDYIALEYRLVEREIQFCPKTDAEKVVYRQPIVVSNDPDTAYSNIYTAADESGLFATPQAAQTGQNFTVTNVFRVRKLNISKEWVGDYWNPGNIYNSRPVNAQGKWKVSFVIQRREIIENQEAEAGWTNYKDKAGADYVKDIVSSAEAGDQIHLYTLPEWDLVKENDTYRVVHYEYRARELQSGLNPETDKPLEENDVFDDNYEVTYSKEALNPDGSEENITKATNTLKDKIDIYAEKQWRDNDNVTLDVRLELQYLKEGKTLETAEEADWLSFTTPAVITLDGIVETLGDKIPYQEYEPWKAIWKDVPKVVDGSAKNKDGTIYRVVELNKGMYCTTDENKGGRIEEDAYTFTNTPTKLKIFKAVTMGKTNIHLPDKEYSFTLTAPADVTLNETYKAASFMTGADGKPGEASNKSITLNEDKNELTFTLKEYETIIIYGLPKGKKFTVTEAGGKSYTFETEKVYETTGITPSEPETDKANEYTVPAEKPEESSIPVIAYTNNYYGTIHLWKSDDNGTGLDGAMFKLEYREGDSGEFKPMDEKACMDLSQFTVNEAKEYTKTTSTVNGKAGVLVFDMLTLGYQYRITEIKGVAGHHPLMEPFIVKDLPLLTATSPERDAEISWVGQTGKEGDIGRQYVYCELKYEVGNNAALTMPSTGGNEGFFWQGFIGAAMLLAGFFLLENRDEKKKKKSMRK